MLATELTAYPPSLFYADGQMRVVAGKSTLKKNIQVDVSQRLTISQQLSWWICQLLFEHLNGLLMELLPLSYPDSRYGSQLISWLQSNMIFHDGMQLWAQKTGKSTAAPKL